MGNTLLGDDGFLTRQLEETSSSVKDYGSIRGRSFSRL